MPIRNPSVPSAGVVPVLTYDDVDVAVAWLVGVFGFTERVRIGDHRAQLSFGDGAVIVADATHGRGVAREGAPVNQSVLVRVSDVNAHHLAAVAAGGHVRSEPADHSFGERQYSVLDPGGHLWTFTESIAELQPEEWGGTTVTPW